jgi:hypothetical protein
MASGPYHFKKAEELLLEIERTPSITSPTETSLAIRAVVHAVLASVAATALSASGPDRHAWREVAGVNSANPVRPGSPSSRSGRAGLVRLHPSQVRDNRVIRRRIHRDPRLKGETLWQHETPRLRSRGT